MLLRPHVPTQNPEFFEENRHAPQTPLSYYARVDPSSEPENACKTRGRKGRMTAAKPRFSRSRHMAETDTNRVTVMRAEAERRADARLAAHVITRFLNIVEVVNDNAADQVAKGLRSSPDFDHP